MYLLLSYNLHLPELCRYIVKIIFVNPHQVFLINVIQFFTLWCTGRLHRLVDVQLTAEHNAHAAAILLPSRRSVSQRLAGVEDDAEHGLILPHLPRHQMSGQIHVWHRRRTPSGRPSSLSSTDGSDEGTAAAAASAGTITPAAAALEPAVRSTERRKNPAAGSSNLSSTALQW